MNKGSESGGAVTNGIEMESDEEESDDLFPPVPPPQVVNSLLLTKRQTQTLVFVNFGTPMHCLGH